ncbi:hypothetical protein AHF37_06588 [Paragonimus kellicotti]|nr:hypothetical protein AHF37_06588 [Paragonimus kellicotti]
MLSNHKLNKRARIELDYESPSESSECKSYSNLWESLVPDFRQIIDDDLSEFEQKSNPNATDSSLVEYCTFLAQDLYTWLKNFREKIQLSRKTRIQKYVVTSACVTLQQQDSKKHALVDLAVKLFHGDQTRQLDSVHTLTECLSSAWTDGTAVQSAGSVRLAELLEQLLGEWDRTALQVQPIDPVEKSGEFFRDIQVDLDDIDHWLNMLRPNLPATNSWMTTLNKLTDMQRRAASNFYQTSLKQIEEHSRTLCVIMHLLDTLTNQKKEDLTVRVKADSLVQFAKYLENECHLQWLRLLELTLCIDQKNLQIFSVATHLSSQRKRQKTFFTINPSSKHSAFNFGMSKDGNGRFPCNVIFNPLESREQFHGLKMQSEITMSSSGPKSTKRHRATFLSQPTIYKCGPESGFESELSPQLNCFSKATIKPGTSCPHPMRRSTDSLTVPVSRLHPTTGKLANF